MQRKKEKIKGGMSNVKEVPMWVRRGEEINAFIKTAEAQLARQNMR